MKTRLDTSALKEAARSLAREMAQGYRPTDVQWLENFAQEISEHAVEQSEFVSGQKRDPNLVTRIIEYMTTCLAMPVIGYSTPWFMATFDALLELSCPNHGGVESNEPFYREVELGVASSRADYSAG